MKSLGYTTDMSNCHGADVWSMDCNILRLMFVDLLAFMPNFDQAVIEMFNCLSIDKGELLCYFPGYGLLLHKV